MTKDNNLDFFTVNEIIKKTIDEIIDSRGQIVDIVDNARLDHENIKSELDTIRKKAEQIINEVDALEIKDKMMRRKLAEVSKNFGKYSEAEVQVVYEQAFEVKTDYITKKNEEKELIRRRNQLELTLKNTIKTIESAEKAINQISIAVSYLKGEILSAIEGLDKNSEMVFGIQILEAQESERKRISRDIHDGPAQHIANIVMKADICEKVIKKDMEQGLNELTELKEAVKIALKEVRSIIYDLRPMSLDDLGLNNTLEDFVKKFTKDNDIKINLKLKTIKEEIESIIQVAVFRIVQEIFNNIKKHSRATNVEMTLDYGTKYLRMIVVDNGIGFNVDNTLKEVKAKKESYGILGILERVKQLQGTIKIDSSEGKGASYIIKLPVSREVIKDERKGN